MCVRSECGMRTLEAKWLLERETLFSFNSQNNVKWKWTKWLCAVAINNYSATVNGSTHETHTNILSNIFKMPIFVESRGKPTRTHHSLALWFSVLCVRDCVSVCVCILCIQHLARTKSQQNGIKHRVSYRCCSLLHVFHFIVSRLYSCSC